MADQGEPRPVQRTRDGGSYGRQDKGSGSGRNGVATAAADLPSAAGAGLYPRRPAFGALDLGTNNCRLLIARPDGDDFIIVDAFSRIVRLGEGLAASGRISDAAMDRAIDALRICADKLSRRRVLLSRAVATEACRQAANGEEFIARVRNETGIVLDIISAEEEARLAVMGCHQLMTPGDAPGLVFDIGGGSTELVLIDGVGREPQILDWVSIPWGVVSLTEAHRHDTLDPVARAEGYAVMRAAVRPVINGFAERLRARLGDFTALPLRILGTSGTVTTLASLQLGLSSYDRSRVDGISIASSDMRRLCAHLADLPMPERERLPCVGKERADLVVSGCAVLEEILDMWPAAMVNVADRGIREGVLRGLMRAHAGSERGA
jgi:exopolyphosphatase/guanosine-5'-triphosphate,3'-diphosphate pyrophosphatase